MVGNKQDLPKKLAEPFGSSCQFESEGMRPSFYPKGKAFRERAEMQGEGALWWSCGGGGIIQEKESPVTRAGSLMFPLPSLALQRCYLQRLQPPGTSWVLSSDSQSALLQGLLDFSGLLIGERSRLYSVVVSKRWGHEVRGSGWAPREEPSTD